MSRAWPTVAEMTLDAIKAEWEAFYDIGYAGGAYWALWLLGGPPLTAATPDGLDSAIRADYARRRGGAR